MPTLPNLGEIRAWRLALTTDIHVIATCARLEASLDAVVHTMTQCGTHNYSHIVGARFSAEWISSEFLFFPKYNCYFVELDFHPAVHTLSACLL